MLQRKTDRFARSFFAKDILQRLRMGIISGEIPAKYRLVEAQLATEYGVSRGPVRSAIHALEQHGLVRSLRSGGAEVIGFTKKHAADFFNIRQRLEEMASEYIIEQDVIDVTALRLITDTMANSGLSMEQLHDLDIDFHHEFMKLADNWALLQLWNTLDPVISDMLTLTNSLHPDAPLIAANHNALLVAIEDRDLKYLHHLINEQIKLPKRLILERFKQLENEAAMGKLSN